MDQPEEPMEIDTSVSFAETDKLEDPMEPHLSMNLSNNQTLDDFSVLNQLPESRYENRGGTFTTGIDIFSTEEKLKMEERAKRFGLTEQNKNSMEDREPELYMSLGIAEENESVKNLRLNALHMRGTEEMSTKDVFKYFEDYAPASIEWINDLSCNVVWLDNVTAARALLRLSKRIDGLGEKVKIEKDSLDSESNDEINENNITNDECIIEVIGEDTADATQDKKKGNSIDIKDINCPLPPGLWRKGIDCPKSKYILLRFATRADKKQPNAEKMSDYYKKYGNPNFGGVRGILTESRKRLYKELRHGRKRPKQESSASDDSSKTGTKNPWGTLSQTWGVNDFTEEDFINKPIIKEFINKPIIKDQGISVKERLGLKQSVKEMSPNSEESEEDSEAESDDEWCKRSKVMRMRMHADDEEAKVQKRRQQIKHQVATLRTSRSDDLRSRLGNSRKPPTIFRDAIQVVVTNSRVVAPDSQSTKIPEDEVTAEEPRGEDDEEEEGEIVDDVEEEVEEVLEDSYEEVNEEEGEEEEESSDESEKEVQGPRGSVIKVVQHKPRVASTVWARLNNKKTEDNETIEERRPTKGDLRDTLRGDLRSRLGKQTRGRSPLRIEVKNDKYAKNESDSE